MDGLDGVLSKVIPTPNSEEPSKLSRKVRIEPFKTFSEFCMITHDLPLKAFSLQPVYLSSYLYCSKIGTATTGLDSPASADNQGINSATTPPSTEHTREGYLEEPDLFFFSCFTFRFAFGSSRAFFRVSLLPLSFFPLSPIAVSPFVKMSRTELSRRQPFFDHRE